MPIAGKADAELAKLFADTGIDLSTLPTVIMPEQLATLLGTTEGSLAQERYRHTGIPYIKLNRRVRYLRADVARYLLANRRGAGA